MNRERIIVRTSLFGILANITLVTGKAITGFFAHSVAIIMDAINNLTDALSSFITIIGAKLAHRKPDRKHPYGHGRIEYVTSALVSAIILFAGVSAIIKSIESIVNNHVVGYNITSIIIISAALFIKIGVGLYFINIGKKVNSDALRGSGVDALFDAMLSIGTLVAIIVNLTTSHSIDGYIGVVIGLFIIKSGIGILRNSISQIVGERVNQEISTSIKHVVLSHHEVKGAYDLILNNYGPEKAIGSIHIEIDDEMTAKEIHALTRSITEEIYTKFGFIITIGIYATNTYSEELLNIKKNLIKMVKNDYKMIKQVHGFYLDESRKLISFDIVIDFDEKYPEEVKQSLYKRMSEKYPQYNFYIIIDTDISD